MHGFVNILKITELQNSNGWVVWYINYISIELLPKKEKKSIWPSPSHEEPKAHSDSTECTKDKAVLQKYKGYRRLIHVHTEDKTTNM